MIPGFRRKAASLGVIAALAASALPACAYDIRQGLNVPLFPYADEGPFVTGPGQFVAALPAQIGVMAGSFLCLPVSLAQGEVPPEKEASIVCGKALGTALGWPVYAAVSLPFFLLKKGFWDAPRAIAGLGRDRSGSAQAPLGEPGVDAGRGQDEKPAGQR